MDSPELQSDETRLLQWANVILSHRVLIVLLMIAAGATAFALCRMAEPLYTAEAKLMPDRDAATMSLKGLFLSSLPKSANELADRAAATYYSELLQSDLLLTPLIARTWGNGKSLGDLCKINGKTARDPERAILALLKGRIFEITQDRLSGLISLRCTTTDPAASAELANALVDGLTKYLREDTRENMNTLLAIADARTSEAQAGLRVAEDALNKFRMRNRTITEPDVELEMGRLQRAVTFQEEVLLRVKTPAELLRLSEQKDMSLIDVIQAAKVPVGASWPPTTAATVGAILFGLMLGLTIAFARNGIRQMAERDAPGYLEFEKHVRSLNWMLPGVILMLPADRRRRRPTAAPRGTAETTLASKAGGS